MHQVRLGVAFILLWLLLVQAVEGSPTPPEHAYPTITEASFLWYDKNHATAHFCYNGDWAEIGVDKVVEGYGNAWQWRSIVNNGGCFTLEFPPYASNNDYTLFPYADFDTFYITVQFQNNGASTSIGPYRWRSVRAFVPLVLHNLQQQVAPKHLVLLPIVRR